jgi:hypothetical protein
MWEPDPNTGSKGFSDATVTFRPASAKPRINLTRKLSGGQEIPATSTDRFFAEILSTGLLIPEVSADDSDFEINVWFNCLTS